jgi:hypothetical protein
MLGLLGTVVPATAMETHGVDTVAWMLKYGDG